MGDAGGPGPSGPERKDGRKWGTLTLSSRRRSRRPSRAAAPQSQDSFSVSPSLLPCFYQAFPLGDTVSGHQSTSPLARCPARTLPFFVRMFLYQCAWVCRDSGLSCCGIFISLPGSAFPPLCLTKPVHCFLFITQDSQGGGESSPGEVVGRQGPSLGMDEIMSALFFNFLKNKQCLI